MQQSRNAKIDAALKRAADAGDVPGVVAMATDRNSTIYEGAFGKRVLGQPAPMTADTVAWIASMTKAITSAGAMQLVEQGKLDLDAPAGKIVPEVGAAQVLEGFDAGGQPKTRPPKRPITLRHLLTHTAGFGYEIWSPDIGKYQEAKGIPGVITCQNAALTTPLLFDPGERWFYGINIDWAGKMVEAVSGQRLGAYLQKNVLAPARHDQHRLQDHAGHARAAGQDPPARRRRQARPADGPGAAAGAGVRDGRRRPLLDGRRLPEVRAHDPQPRQGRQHAGAEGGDRRSHDAQQHGRAPACVC